ncbi:hypothetical protein [Priestia koreensis]|nr:hypothetical protein [Priestia koreensis]
MAPRRMFQCLYIVSEDGEEIGVVFQKCEKDMPTEIKLIYNA